MGNRHRTQDSEINHTTNELIPGFTTAILTQCNPEHLHPNINCDSEILTINNHQQRQINIKLPKQPI